MPSAKPRISSAVSPLWRSAISSAPASAGGTSPAPSSLSSAVADASSRCWPPSRRSSICAALKVVIGAVMTRSAVEEVLEQLRALGREHALGVELHALDVERAVPYTHDLAVVGASGDGEVGRQLVAVRRERVVAADLEGVRHAAIDRAGVVLHDRRLAVHERAAPTISPPKCWT